MELFAKIVNGLRPLTIFAKSSMLDVRRGYEYASEGYYWREAGVMRTKLRGCMADCIVYVEEEKRKVWNHSWNSVSIL